MNRRALSMVTPARTAAETQKLIHRPGWEIVAGIQIPASDIRDRSMTGFYLLRSTSEVEDGSQPWTNVKSRLYEGQPVVDIVPASTLEAVAKNRSTDGLTLGHRLHVAPGVPSQAIVGRSRVFSGLFSGIPLVSREHFRVEAMLQRHQLISVIVGDLATHGTLIGAANANQLR